MTAELLRRLRGRLVVSCQAQPHEDLHGAEHMAAMARAVVRGGAAAVRAEGPADVAAIRAVVEVPLIGLWKIGHEGVYITPTVESALAVAAAGADVVAFDGTARPRPDGSTLADLVAALHDVGALAMADVSTYDEGLAAQAAGVDIVSTTLSGYTPSSPPGPEPDLDLVRALAATLTVPVFAEGRIATPDQAAQALRLGAYAVVVGGAITRPTQIAATFAQVVDGIVEADVDDGAHDEGLF